MSSDQQSAVIAGITAGFEPEVRRKRSRLELAATDPSVTVDYDDEDGRPPPLPVIPLLASFPGIPRAPIIALYDNVFSPRKDLLKLRTAEFRSLAPERDYHYVSTASGITQRTINGRRRFSRSPSTSIQ